MSSSTAFGDDMRLAKSVSAREEKGARPETRPIWRGPARIVHGPVHDQAAPLNIGPPSALLPEEFFTPEERFFVRNHGNIPCVNEADFRLSIDGRVSRELHLSLAVLRTRFTKRIVPATLVCAGLRRKELQAVKPISGEFPWGGEAIGNAQWAGAALGDVLEAAGVSEGTLHAAFLGLDDVHVAGTTGGFGGSIPIEKALGTEVLLAYEMNGEPLTPVHGFPVRVVVPGYIGARSVKWLSRITLQNRPSENYFQARAYQLPASRNGNGESGSVMLGEQYTNALICSPADGETVMGGRINVRGYAISGGRRIERVEISTDGGRNWTAAALRKQHSEWTWSLWESEIELPRGRSSITVRAWDSAGETQPASAADVWNPKGYMNNSWHSVKVLAT